MGMLEYVILGYLIIGTVIMYVYLNDRVTYTIPSICALLVCIILWLPIITKFFIFKYMKNDSSS